MLAGNGASNEGSHIHRGEGGVPPLPSWVVATEGSSMQVWWRVCVDLDRTGQPLGISAERHDEASTLEVRTATPGPFDTADEAWCQALKLADLQLALFP